MKKNLFVDMLANNKRELILFKLWRIKLKLNVRLSSRSLLLRRLKEEHRQNTSRTFVSTSKMRKPRRELDSLRRNKRIRDYVNSMSYKQPKTINSNLRLRDKLKRDAWRRTSRLRWPRNSQKTSVLSRWMPRKEECANSNTREISNSYGKRN